MKNFLFTVFSLVLHAIAFALLIYIFLPIVKWYLESRPLWGVDFYLIVNLASVLHNNFALPFAFWNYGWFGGWPQFTYPFLTIYITSFLSNFWGILIASQIMVMSFTALFILGAYFFFYRIGKNHVLAFILAVFTALSGGVYETLTWAGSLPSYSSQAALPWVLGFIVWYQKTNKIRYLLAAALISGVSIFIHPLVFMTYIVPAVVILTFLHFENGFRFFPKIKAIIVFLTIALIIGLPQFYSSLGFAIKSTIRPNATSAALSTTKAPPNQLERDIAEFNRQQVDRIFTDNHDGIFMTCAVLIVLFTTTLVFSRRVLSILEILPYGFLVLYFWFYIWLFGQGISIYHGGWYRVFWSVPIWVGALAAACWFYAEKNVHKVVTSTYLKLSFLILSDLLLLFLGYVYFHRFPQLATFSSIIYRGELSSAHPDILNRRPSDNQKEQYKSKLIPSWFNANDTNYRLYDPDQTVNIWWNSLFRMPLARGYLDPPIDDSKRGFIFLLDSALSEANNKPQLTSVFKYPEETAVSNALFLVDWNAIKYYEGGHVGGTSSPAVPNYLTKLLVKRDEVVDLTSLKYIPGKTRTMHFYEFKDELTSPILSATNTSTLGIFASENGLETVIRSIAERDNINSRRLIPLNLGQIVDNYKLEDLKKFDALYLYDYDYKNYDKIFKLLDNYVRSGKKVFIETGVDVKQSAGSLGDFFPVKRVERRGLGREWSLETPDKQLTSGVDINKFSPLEFDNDDWKVSYAEDSDLQQNANIVLKDKGKIVLASHKVGSGEVVWSGINLAYHLERYHNLEEAKLFDNILASIVDISAKNMPDYKVDFVNANKRIISTQGAKGILFKEQAYNGWHASFLSGGTGSLKIYKAGPAYPGYMYIPLSGAGKSEIELSFGGSVSHKILLSISFIVSVLIFEEVAFRGFILGRIRKWMWLHTRRRMGKWWEREDE